MHIKKLFFFLSQKFKKKNIILLIGMGRSGTTWAGDVINYKKQYRILFEPFFPAKVKEVKNFEYIQYLAPKAKNKILTSQALRILSGNISPNKWVDRDTKKNTNNPLIVKDIRCNLMVGWLQKIAGYPPTVLIIRHPLQVVSSWKNLGWGKEALGTRSDLEIIISQKSLLEDFPIIKKVLKEIDMNEYNDKIVFLWCILYLVPLANLKADCTYLLYYENLVNDYDNEVSRVFKFLDKPFNLSKLQEMKNTSSSTNFQNRDFKNSKYSLSTDWKNEFSEKEIQRASYIINAFKLNYLYDNEGRPKNYTFVNA